MILTTFSWKLMMNAPKNNKLSTCSNFTVNQSQDNYNPHYFNIDIKDPLLPAKPAVDESLIYSDSKTNKASYDINLAIQWSHKYFDKQS